MSKKKIHHLDMIRLESMLDSLKIHLQKGPAQSQEQFWKDLTWNLATQSHNIVLTLLNESYPCLSESTNTPTEDA